MIFTTTLFFQTVSYCYYTVWGHLICLCYKLKQTVEQTPTWLVVWDAMKLMWHHCNMSGTKPLLDSILSIKLLETIFRQIGIEVQILFQKNAFESVGCIMTAICINIIMRTAGTNTVVTVTTTDHRYIDYLMRWRLLRVYSDTKVHGANMGPSWVLSAPDGPHFGPINFAIRVALSGYIYVIVVCPQLRWLFSSYSGTVTSWYGHNFHTITVVLRHKGSVMRSWGVPFLLHWIRFWVNSPVGDERKRLNTPA